MSESTEVIGSIQKPTDVVLKHWQVWEVNIERHHVIGYDEKKNEERVSSRIVKWDPDTHKLQTIGGTVYRISGLSDDDPDTNKVWTRWQTRNSISTALNISADYFVSMYRYHIARKVKNANSTQIAA